MLQVLPPPACREVDLRSSSYEKWHMVYAMQLNAFRHANGGAC